MKVLKNVFYNLVAGVGVLFFPLAVFAEEIEVCVEEPIWFSVLEALGVIIAAIGLYYIYKITKIQSQGILGKAFKYFGVGIISVSIAMVYKSVIEVFGIENGYIHELIYEAFVYLMVIMFAVGSHVAYEALSDMSNIKK